MSAGYLAVINPKHTEANVALQKLITEEQYLAHTPGDPIPERAATDVALLPEDDAAGDE